MGFNLDTPGAVDIPNSGGQVRRGRLWSDLSPFAQGTLTAATEELQRQLDAQKHGLWVRVGFANWSPEALAMILADCKAYASRPFGTKDVTDVRPIREAGTGFWSRRQNRYYDAFPPLPPYLGDDGKVHLKVSP